MASTTTTRRQTVPPRPDQPQPGPASWPLHAALELGALPTAPGCARAWTWQILREWGLAPLSDSTGLLVSELATNAVQASRAVTGAAIWLWLIFDRKRVVILVWDASPQPPVPADPGEDAENGRGLLLVQALSQQWGWYFPDHPGDASSSGQGGKVVWAVVASLARFGSHPNSATLVRKAAGAVDRFAGLAEFSGDGVGGGDGARVPRTASSRTSTHTYHSSGPHCSTMEPGSHGQVPRLACSSCFERGYPHLDRAVVGEPAVVSLAVVAHIGSLFQEPDGQCVSLSFAPGVMTSFAAREISTTRT